MILTSSRQNERNDVNKETKTERLIFNSIANDIDGTK